jgi:D-serine deaminase-like pyridoxal phosphate-dependent protein
MSEHGFARAAGSTAVSPLNKGLGLLYGSLEPEAIVALGWNLLNEDLCLPCAVLYRDKLQHNLDWMQQFIEAYGVRLAPHGKTTMAPKLFHMQLQAGAWGITLATAHQTMTAWKHGVKRVLMANQLVGKQNMAVIAHLLEDREFEYYCLVDSAQGVEQLGRFFVERGLRANVLLEMGVAGGRTGVRDESQLESVLTALARWRSSVALCGVELYEGVLDNEQEIRAFLKRTVDTARDLATEGWFERSPILMSGAGSAWYDVVAEEFAAARFNEPVEIVLRPGCYLTHDAGAYKKAQARILAGNPIAKKLNDGLAPALQVWANVQSVPEPARAIIGLGKRDAAFDSGLPTPALHYRPGEAAPMAAPAHWLLTKMMDQHAYMQIAADDKLEVGDMIGFDISHPCLTFDKWRVLPIVDAEYTVVDLVQTFF